MEGLVNSGDEAEWTVDELLAVCIARQIKDGDMLAQGLATPLVAAGYLLAWHTHAPHACFASAIGQSVCREGAPLGLATAEVLWLDRAMNAFGFVSAVLDLLPAVKPIEFFRPGQLDAHGNFNNIAIGRELRRPRLRLPGVGGIPDVTVYFPASYLYVPRHSRVTFVGKLDRISGLGHSDRRKQGGGPRYLVTDLGEFDFPEGRMRLVNLHPGVSLADVRRRTGFEFDMVREVGETVPPTGEQVRLLRHVVDPLGVRRLEFQTGPQRRETMRTILAQESPSRLG